MKCEMIRDLLPLYIDGLTSEASNQEIEKHLKSCRECREYYQEMAGELPDSPAISQEEIRDVEIIKKIKKKSRKETVGILAGGILAAALLFCFLFSQSVSQVKFEDVKMDYGVRGDKVYMTMESRPGYELWFSGGVNGNDSEMTVLAMRKMGGFGKDVMNWEDTMGTSEDPCRWTIKFRDKTIVIENGELVEENAEK